MVRGKLPERSIGTCELEVWFSGLGKVRLEFSGSVDIHVIGRIIGDHVL